MVKCNNCSLVYLNPRPTEDSIKYYYDDNYYDRYDEKIADEKYKLLLKYTNKENLEGLNIIDIGCANGLFLKKIREVQAFPFGVEISETAVKLARKEFGLDNIFYGRITDSPFDENKFDIITLWSVLEHLHSPKSSLEKIFSLLNRKGIVVILIPNFNSIPAIIMHKNWKYPIPHNQKRDNTYEY